MGRARPNSRTRSPHTLKLNSNFELCKQQISAIFNEKREIRERCKGVLCVDLGESFPTSIYLQNLASIQPRTSRSKFGSQITHFDHMPSARSHWTGPRREPSWPKADLQSMVGSKFR